jgi:hypothetical protein
MPVLTLDTGGTADSHSIFELATSPRNCFANALRLSAVNWHPGKLVSLIIYLPFASKVLSLMTPMAR